MRYRGERRRVTKNIIKKRKKKILHILTSYRKHYRDNNPFENNELYEGELKNNNMMNAYGGGCYRKTTSRKASQTFRHHGRYGPAYRYMAHDERQLEAGKQQIEEFINTIGE